MLLLEICPKTRESLKIDVCTHVCSSIVHSNQKVEINQGSTDEETDQRRAGHRYDGLLLSLKKKGLLTC